jgi:alkanesulfonate monooxygenase SsuD/methylene tetrahydromethanopterin reductase-like flavin-dependent oxidoreductase (luciferase family)
MQRGQRGPLPRPIEPALLESMWLPQEKFNVQRMLAASACGAPASVQQQLASIVEQTAADELIVAGAVHDHAARLRSYELLAGVVATPSLPTSRAGSS